MEEIDKRRKAKIPVKNVPVPVQWLLKNATGGQLDYLDRMGKGEEFRDFVNLISNFKHYNVYEAFNYIAKDEKDLALFRASKRGELAGLDALIMVCQLAKEEKERRKKLKEVRK